MLNTLLAIGAGFLIGSKQARDKAGDMIKETFGNIAKSFVKKEKAVADETTDKQSSEISTVSDAPGTTSL